MQKSLAGANAFMVLALRNSYLARVTVGRASVAGDGENIFFIEFVVVFVLKKWLL